MANYWDRHYLAFTEESPSPFCSDVTARLLSPDDNIIELGCGNGRDALTLVLHAKRYVGIDLSERAVERAQSRFLDAGVMESRYSFEVGDFSEYNFSRFRASPITVYSRFSIHAIDEAAEDRLIENLSTCTDGPMRICIEARTIHDELFGQGECISRNAYVTDHFRRFLDPREFVSKFENRDFQVDEFHLSRGFAPYKNEDPIVLRVVFSRGIT